MVKRVLPVVWAAAWLWGQAPTAGRMTLEEKIALLHGARDPEDLGEAGYWPGLPRLGIPAMRLADGPCGVSVAKPATGMPAPVLLAATFDGEAARLYGMVMGRDARALRQDVLLAPQVDIVRDPLFRRNHTTLGEDPLLNGRMGAFEVRGIQSAGVMAQVKHFAAYNGSNNVAVDEETLHEIYLPPFEAAAEAGAASVMCAYNRLNGPWSCGSESLENGILRGLWRFTGFVTSDWGATHAASDLRAGLDMEMPGRPLAFDPGGPYFTEALKTAVPEAAIDEAVGRILEQMARFGWLDGRRAAAKGIDVEGDAAIIRKIATEGAVLLTNHGGTLPLTDADLQSLAVIGPTGGQLAVGAGGERAYGFEERFVSPVEALRRSAPGARITYAVGDDLTGVPLQAGSVTVAHEGEYTFMIQPAGAAMATLAVDGRTVARASGGAKKWSSLLPTTDGRDNIRATVRLAAGEHKVETGASAGEVRFAWMTPERREADFNAAVAAAKSARTAVVFAWSVPGESLALPDGQDELIERVAAANPRTVVVLNTGGAVAMPWKDKVRAILELWYGGQEGGWAAADLLLGRANPSGKLPVTFPARIEDTPAHAAGHPERLAPEVAGFAGIAEAPVTTFSEGTAVGYRWYDRQKIEPLFAFGHGLSYTRFEYSRLEVKRAGDGINVSFTLRNIGARRGAEVAQVYAGGRLAWYERVDLGAGESRRVTATVGMRALSHWSVERHGWVMDDGEREIRVGSSSRDSRLTGVPN